MGSFSSNAILAKARAMYNQRLTSQDYEELLKRRNINDLVNYLKSDSAYSDVLSQLKDANVHREQLESLLDKEIFNRLVRLLRYANKKDLPFYTLQINEIEVQLILAKARLIESDYYSGYELDIPGYINQYASFNLYGLLTVNDYDGLLQLLKSTSYYSVLKKFEKKDNQKIDFNMMEVELKRLYYQKYFALVNELFKGKKRDDLITIMNTSIELQNITKIYRLKKYFNASASQIKEVLFMEYSRIPKKTMNELIEAKDASEFLQKLATSPYKLYVDDNEFVYIEYFTGKIQYNLAKRYMRFSTDSALVFMTYKLVFQVEIDNLKHIIEGLRYNEPANQIASMLIY
ncbi:MAG: V-type ATPase subunit [Erysipelotrichaceae bacterium]|nr:V-type ATPase subunit [Erysipelotrichaceae bacterium]